MRHQPIEQPATHAEQCRMFQSDVLYSILAESKRCTNEPTMCFGKVAEEGHLVALDVSLVLSLLAGRVWLPKENLVVHALGQHQVAQPAYAVHIRPMNLCHAHSPQGPLCSGPGDGVDSMIEAGQLAENKLSDHVLCWSIIT